MKLKINSELCFQRAGMEELESILELYIQRIQWFKQKGIKQWGKYLENHPREEFVKTIENGNYYILKRQNEIVAGFEISTNSNFWKDTTANAYYLYKVVTKVGYKNIGSEIFKIAKKITKESGKKYLRLDCLSSNKKLNELYEKYGFKYVKEGESFYHYTLREWKANG